MRMGSRAETYMHIMPVVLVHAFISSDMEIGKSYNSNTFSKMLKQHITGIDLMENINISEGLRLLKNSGPEQFGFSFMRHNKSITYMFNKNILKLAIDILQDNESKIKFESSKPINYYIERIKLMFD